MPSLSQPFADFLNVSFSSDDFAGALDAVVSVAAEAGAVSRFPGLFDVGDGGTLKYRERGPLGWVSVSGRALAHLREAGLFLDLLSAVAEHPHNVSTLHVCVDVDEDGPRAVARWYKRGRSGGVALTRKPVPSSQVRLFAGSSPIDGRSTGTVYLGAVRRDVRCKVYDKQAEIVDRAVKVHGESADVIALNDPGPLTRYELELGRKVGVTLRDAAEPSSVFVQFMSNVLDLSSVDCVRPWVPHAEPFSMPRREVDYARQLELLLENSADLRRACVVADKLGEHGRDYLLSRLRRLSVTSWVPSRPGEAR